MAEILLFEPDQNFNRAITANLEVQGHTVLEPVTTLPEAYDVMRDLIEHPALRDKVDALVMTDMLYHDGLSRYPDFVGPYVSLMPDDLAELQPSDSPGLFKGFMNLLRRKNQEQEELPETTTLERMPMGSDAALIAEINRLYDLRLPIVGMAEMPLGTRGVEIDPDLDLTKANWYQLGGVVTAVAEERARRRQLAAEQKAQAIRDAGARIRARRGSAMRRTRRPEQ